MNQIRIEKVPRKKYQAVRTLCDSVLDTEDGESVWLERGEYWAAYDGESLVGFGGLVRSLQWCDAVYFHSSGVAESARGRHLQRRLIRARLRWAKQHGFGWAITYTVVYNPASAASLIACGFKPYWPRKPWAGHVCYWRKKI
jgi:GNAT superfamily N-acetyltransferase